MAGSAAEVRIKGLRELNAAFKKADADTRREFKETLIKVAEPVRIRAESLAVSNITNVGTEWSKMRIGATMKSVYIAPQKKGRKTGPQKRPNLGTRLVEDAMEPALEEMAEVIMSRVEDMLDAVTVDNGFS